MTESPDMKRFGVPVQTELRRICLPVACIESRNAECSGKIICFHRTRNNDGGFHGMILQVNIMPCLEYTAFNSIQKYIEDNGYELLSAEFVRIPNVELKELSAEDRVELDKLIERLEEDDDVQNVYHTMKTEDEE